MFKFNIRLKRIEKASVNLTLLSYFTCLPTNKAEEVNTRHLKVFPDCFPKGNISNSATPFCIQQAVLFSIRVSQYLKWILFSFVPYIVVINVMNQCDHIGRKPSFKHLCHIHKSFLFPNKFASIFFSLKTKNHFITTLFHLFQALH